MTDISDVTALLEQMAAGAVYPNTTASPGVAGAGVVIKVFEGWPAEKALDADIRAGNVQVSIYPRMGNGTTSFQVLPRYETVVASTRTLGVSVSGSTVTLTGAPSAGEFVTLVIDYRFRYSRGGGSVDAILAALASDMQADFPNTVAGPTTLQIPLAFSVVARTGAAGKVGAVTHRQRHQVLVTVWAPTPASRNKVAAAIDAAFKAKQRLVFADGSQGLLFYSSTMLAEERVNVGIFRRDLAYDVEFATLDVFDGVDVTVFNIAQDPSVGDSGKRSQSYPVEDQQ